MDTWNESKLSPQNLNSILADIIPNKKIILGDILEEKRENEKRIK